MAIYELSDTGIKRLQKTTFADRGIRERQDIQRLLRDQIEIISDQTMVIAEEFGDWDASRRRIDLLCIDKEANLVVIELKRTEDGGHMELQAIRSLHLIQIGVEPILIYKKKALMMILDFMTLQMSSIAKKGLYPFNLKIQVSISENYP